MRLLTSSGPVDLAFAWPPGTLHEGRKAARAACERAVQVAIMRGDPTKANGYEVLLRETRVGDRRIEVYQVVAPPTEAELQEEVWVREGPPGGPPMANREGRLLIPRIEASRAHRAVDLIADAVRDAVGACEVQCIATPRS
jgi:nucleotide-binding universal stress UspA family protein